MMLPPMGWYSDEPGAASAWAVALLRHPVTSHSSFVSALSVMALGFFRVFLWFFFVF
jgi:hypothetical protein